MTLGERKPLPIFFCSALQVAAHSGS